MNKLRLVFELMTKVAMLQLQFASSRCRRTTEIKEQVIHPCAGEVGVVNLRITQKKANTVRPRIWKLLPHSSKLHRLNIGNSKSLLYMIIKVGHFAHLQGS